MQSQDRLRQTYEAIKEQVLQAGFGREIEWQRSRTLLSLQESEFLRELAWVILCSGFRESTVRKVFDYVALCFCDFESSALIVRNGDLCVASASRRFGHEQKLRGIVRAAEIVNRDGIDSVTEKIKVDGPAALRQFPFIGPVTACHLAKNLGYLVAKPDRHLNRMAAKYGFNGTATMCRRIAMLSGDTVPVVDIVLWRFAALRM